MQHKLYNICTKPATWYAFTLYDMLGEITTKWFPVFKFRNSNKVHRVSAPIHCDKESTKVFLWLIGILKEYERALVIHYIK